MKKYKNVETFFACDQKFLMLVGAVLKGLILVTALLTTYVVSLHCYYPVVIGLC